MDALHTAWNHRVGIDGWSIHRDLGKARLSGHPPRIFAKVSPRPEGLWKHARCANAGESTKPSQVLPAGEDEERTHAKGNESSLNPQTTSIPASPSAIAFSKTRAAQTYSW